MRNFIYVLMLIINLILQSTLFEYISIIGIKPNTAIIIIVSIAFMRGEVEGTIIGFLVGLLQDSFFGPFIGVHALLGMLTGYFCGKFFSGFYKESFIIPLVLTITSNIMYEFVFYVTNILLRGYTKLYYFINTIILPEVVYTAIFSVFLYKLLYIINRKIEEKESLKKKLF